MKSIRSMAFTTVLILVLAACSSSDDAESTTSVDGSNTIAGSSDVQRQPENSSSFFSIEEVLLGSNGYVALNNFTGVPVTLDGLYLCQGGDCFSLPDEIIQPGGTMYVAVGSAPEVDGPVITDATIGDLAPSDGELALYVTDPTDSERIIMYLEWGSTPHERTDAAIAAGIWLEGSHAPSGDNAVRLYRNPDSGLWLWDAA